jgi:hypothetical protein
MLLETREPHQEFIEHNRNQQAIFVSKYDSDKNVYEEQVEICLNKTATMKDLRLAIEAQLHVPYESQRIFKERTTYSYNTTNDSIMIVDIPEDDEVRHSELSSEQELYVEYP